MVIQKSEYESLKQTAELSSQRMHDAMMAEDERDALRSRQDAALAILAAFDLNGVAPRDKLGAALDCIAQVRTALEGEHVR